MSFISEFKEFINRGNVMDMAVGVIIGGAFTSIVTSLTNDIINPLIKLITGGNEADIPGLTIPVPGTTNGIDFGSFISAVINFLIIALVVFIIVRAFNRMRVLAEGPIKEDPVCPFCKEDIKEGASRCPHCTGEIPDSTWEVDEEEENSKKILPILRSKLPSSKEHTN